MDGNADLFCWNLSFTFSIAPNNFFCLDKMISLPCSSDKTSHILFEHYSDKILYDNSVSIHRRNLQALATEMFKIHGGLSPDILREIFVPKISLYNLRRNSTFERRQVHSVYHGAELLSFLGLKIWDLVPLELKQLESLEVFKLKIKKWIPFECPCRLCRTYIQQVGFV